MADPTQHLIFSLQSQVAVSPFPQLMEDAAKRIEELAAENTRLSERNKELEALIGNKVLLDIALERDRQNGKWGGPEHDDRHTVAEWVQIIQDYAGWARIMGGMSSYVNARRRLMQVAALAVAACESLDRFAAPASLQEAPQGEAQ